MKISEILASSTEAFPSLEIVPPLKGMTRRELMDSIRPFMEFSPKYINVTCHRDEYEFRMESDGTYSRHLVRNRVSEVAVCGAIMAEFGIDVVPHIICGGAGREEIESELYDLRFMGIENIMALRGDSISGEKRFTPAPGGYGYASELVGGIRAFEKKIGSHVFSIGVGGYPEKHFEAANMETDIANLRKKVDAGADYIITQMFFDNRRYFDFVRRCREAGITVPIIPGLKPLSTLRHLEVLPETFSVEIPEELVREVKAHPDSVKQIGTEWAIAQSRELMAAGVPVLHYYTMSRTTNIQKIVAALF